VVWACRTKTCGFRSKDNRSDGGELLEVEEGLEKASKTIKKNLEIEHYGN